MYVNLFPDGALLEEQPQGFRPINVRVDDPTREILLALIRCGDERTSNALAELFLAGINLGRRMPLRLRTPN